MAHPRDRAGDQVHDAHLRRGLRVAHEGAPAWSLACVTLLGDVVRHPGEPHLLRLFREIERHARAVRRHVEAADTLLVLNVERLRRVDLGRVGRRWPASRPPDRVCLEHPKQLALLVRQKPTLSLSRLVLVGRTSVSDVGELRDGSAERVHAEQVVVANEIDAAPITGDLHRGEPIWEGGEQAFPIRSNLQQVEIALVSVSGPGPVLREDRAKSRADAFRLVVGHPLRPSAVAVDPVQALALFVRSLPDEVELLSVGRPAEL